MLFLKNLLLRNFQGCCLLFNYQGSSLFLLIRSSFDILSRRFPFVKNFFIFFLLSVPEVFLPHKSALIGYHIHILLSRTFLFFFQSFQCVLSHLESNGEGGIWTLAPLLTTYSLSRGAPSASLGTSPKCPRIIHAILFSLIPRLSSYASIFSVVHAHLQGKQKEVHSILNFPSGEGGIRTHAPSRTNGFQDRLVMTTSIPLQTSCHFTG